ncbi:MAG: hypothetical protein QME60_04270 [Verrucomicrobiota bacterium]|nr:hypothetical protein [Verrucomicrobiota bacterium]
MSVTMACAGALIAAWTGGANDSDRLGAGDTYTAAAPMVESIPIAAITGVSNGVELTVPPGCPAGSDPNGA